MYGCQEIEENGALCVTDACSHLPMTSCPVTFQSRAKSMVSIFHYNKQRYSFFLQDMVDNLRALVQEMLMLSKQKRFMIGSVIFVQGYFHHVHMLMVVMFLHQKQTQHLLVYRNSLALSFCRQEVPVRRYITNYICVFYELVALKVF